MQRLVSFLHCLYFDLELTLSSLSLLKQGYSKQNINVNEASRELREREGTRAGIRETHLPRTFRERGMGSLAPRQEHVSRSSQGRQEWGRLGSGFSSVQALQHAEQHGDLHPSHAHGRRLLPLSKSSTWKFLFYFLLKKK